MWTRHFRKVDVNQRLPEPPAADGGGAGTSSSYSSYLPEIYAGHPNRIQKNYQYEDMDRDSDINAALDMIADFCTQSEEQSDEPFAIHYSEDATDTQIFMIKRELAKWVKLNNFRSRLWRIFRDTMKYGDMFFLRDPETFEWLWVDSCAVEGVSVNEEDGKEPAEYLIRNLDYCKSGKFATTKVDLSNYKTPFGMSNTYGSRQMAASQSQSAFSMAGANKDPRAMKAMNGNNEVSIVEAKNVVHLSLSEEMDVNWPFGKSILEPVFKVFKQKELLEDSIIIYRVQRAPERRVFYIDTAQMNPAKAKAHLEAIKNEIHQRRIPTQNGGGSAILDAAYNPLSINEDYYFAQGAEGRGSKVETLPGGDNLGEIGDLSFFTKKLARGLRIPPQYLSIGEDSQGFSFNDGKMGSAMIQEFTFNKYCMRLQNLIAPMFDKEFKSFLKEGGIQIDSEIFDLRFNPPQSFSKYRQAEVDMAQVGVYSQIADNKKLSERFKLMRFLGLTEEEIQENERMWKEENASKLKKATGNGPEDESQADLGAVGIRPSGDFGDMGGDLGDDLGGEGGPEGGAAPGGDPAAGGDMGGGGMAGGPPGGAPPAAGGPLG